MAEHVDARGRHWRKRWINCHLAGGYSGGPGPCLLPDRVGCELNGPVELVGYNNGSSTEAFVDCRFIRAQVRFKPDDCGSLTFRRCTFEGPADTLVTALALRGDATQGFDQCVFRNAQYGLVVLDGGGNEAITVTGSRFEDIAASAIEHA